MLLELRRAGRIGEVKGERRGCLLKLMFVVGPHQSRLLRGGGLTQACAGSSGGASAVKEPDHFEVRKSSSQVTRMHFFPQKS